MAWQIPVTDWEASDYYNYGDLNRVESNIDETVSVINTVYGTAPSIQTSFTTRTNLSIEFADSLNRIENNILTIKNFLYEPNGWITPKTTWLSNDVFSYVDAIRLEYNILLLYNLITSSEVSFRRSGDFTCGQDGYEL